MTQKITKGVIAVAGNGTRFLPVTKSLPKEMLPILDKPIVQYVVEEMVAAGITDIVMVTRSDKKVLEDYFDRNVTLEDELRKENKTAILQEVERISDMANFIYIRQKPTKNANYGNGIPVLNAASIVGGEPFVFAYGDDIVKMNHADVSFTQQLLDNYEQNESLVIGCQNVTDDETRLYGIVKPKGEAQGTAPVDVEEIIEKPEPGKAPSNLAAFGRFVLMPEICRILADIPAGKDGELWLTDAIEEYIRRGNRAVAQPVQGGRWFTTGDPLHYLEAVIQYVHERYAQKPEENEYWPAVQQYFSSLVENGSHENTP